MSLQITYTRDHSLRRLIVQIILDDGDMIGLPVSVNYTPRNFLSISQQLLHLAMVAEQLESLTTAVEDDMSISEMLNATEMPDNTEMEDEDNMEEQYEEEEDESEDDDEDDEEEDEDDDDEDGTTSTESEVTDEDSE